jgi:hypothetical protein
LKVTFFFCFLGRSTGEGGWDEDGEDTGESPKSYYYSYRWVFKNILFWLLSRYLLLLQ